MKLFTFISLLLLTTYLARCGSITSGSATSQQSKPNILQIISYNPFPENDFPSLQKTIRDTSKVQELYASLYSLPPYQKPSYVIHGCPPDFGYTYQLHFYKEAVLLQTVTIPISSCVPPEFGSNDQRAISPDIWPLLSKTVGIPMNELLHPKLGDNQIY